ncbi:hypothetical protein B296_00052812 [Ensete ventricosum]|uniref:Uncharacterized protein n=1 Tax=Ensete ventricosum TaxID=4639 RepID=A0A426Y8F1_ENSVE|nr:hypothetical protein B296_00052812 [Ensete ventricosum]
MVENQQILGTKGKKVRTFGAPELDDGVDEALVEVGRPSEPRLRVRREYQAGAVCRARRCWRRLWERAAANDSGTLRGPSVKREWGPRRQKEHRGSHRAGILTRSRFARSGSNRVHGARASPNP